MATLEYWYLPEHKLVITRIIGRASAEEIVELVKRMALDPQIDPQHKNLQDNRESDLNFKYEELLKLMKAVEKEIKYPPLATATIIKDIKSYGISRMAESVFSEIKIDINPFIDLKEALRYLGMPEDLKLPYESESNK